MADTDGSKGSARRRALLTDRERELIASGEVDNQRYVAVSRVRTKIQDELPDDLALLAENHPGLFNEVRDVVRSFDPTEQDSDAD